MSLAQKKPPNPFAPISKATSSLAPLHPHASDVLWHIDITHTSSEHPIVFNALHQTNPSLKFQWGFKKSELTHARISEILNLSSKGFNVYMSQASFLKPYERTKHNSFASECLIIDVDYYNIPTLKGFSPQQVLDQMESEGLFSKIKPSYAMSSRNGLYLVYLLDLVPLYRFKRNVRLWELVAKALVEHFKDYGADPKATDISRVNRLPYSINQKTMQKGSIINFSAVKKTSPPRYTLSFLADQVLPYAYDEVIEYKKVQKDVKKATTTSTKPKNLFNPYTLSFARCEDLEMLLEIRDYDIDGYRNTFLFLYSLFLIDKLVNFDNSLLEVTSINNKLLSPLSQSELERTFQSAYKNYLEKQIDLKRGYKFTNDHIIILLSIQENEIKKMKTIISKSEKLSRLKAAQKAKRRNEEGLTSRQQKSKDNETRIKALREEGLTILLIADTLHMSKRQVQRYLKK